MRSILAQSSISILESGSIILQDIFYQNHSFTIYIIWITYKEKLYNWILASQKFLGKDFSGWRFKHVYTMYHAIANQRQNQSLFLGWTLKIVIFSNRKCYFFNFHFLHRGLFQSIICHRFSILGSLMLERNSAAQQSTTLECCRLGCSVGCDDNCTALTSACTGSNTLFECTCCNAVCSSVKLMVVFGNSFEGISWLDLPPPSPHYPDALLHPT